MRALVICGSRKGGFTSEICTSISDGLMSEGIESDIIFPIDMNISHCTGCGECSETGECVIIDDDMDIIYDKFGKADLLVLTTPIHFSGPSSVIKTVIDRFQPYWFSKKDHPAFCAAVMSGGGSEPNFKNTESIFRAFSITTGMEWAGDLRISGTDELELKDVEGPSTEFGSIIGKKIRDLCHR